MIGVCSTEGQGAVVLRRILAVVCLALGLVAGLCIGPGAAQTALGVLADSGTGEPRPDAGLLWNHSGMPAVFPLVVKSAPGVDHYLLLTDPASGKRVLAAYVRAGAFFRVLVPHGAFTLSFASGPAPWQGEVALFGPRTQWLVLPEPLAFAVSGIGSKRGHVVDLKEGTSGATVLAGVHGQVICQERLLDTRSLHAGPVYRSPAPGLPVEPHFTAPHWYVYSHVCG